MLGISSAIVAVKTAVETVGKLNEISKAMGSVELKSTIAQLANELADAQMALAELKQEMNALREENATLKEKKTAEKPKMVWGCFKFEEDPNLYCPACYTTKGLKAPTTRLNIKLRRCSVCQAELGT